MTSVDILSLFILLSPMPVIEHGFGLGIFIGIAFCILLLAIVFIASIGRETWQAIHDRRLHPEQNLPSPWGPLVGIAVPIAFIVGLFTLIDHL